MEYENNFVQGINGRYNFYVIAFDTENNYQNYGEEHIDLSLKDAQKIYQDAVLNNPKHVKTNLGVAYITNKELDRYDNGAVDLLQCINGNIKLIEDYKQSPILHTEGIIAVNTINILSRQLNELQTKLNLQNQSKLRQQNDNGKVSVRSSLKDIQDNLNQHNSQSASINQQIL